MSWGRCPGGSWPGFADTVLLFYFIPVYKMHVFYYTFGVYPTPVLEI